MEIREADARDWPAIWPFFREIVAAGETFPYDLDLTSEQGREVWIKQAPDRTVIAVDGGGTVLGSAVMNRNRGGNGSHVASASYMVAPEARGRGVGRRLVEYSLEWARAAGFRGFQFNAVAETNESAVHLYRTLGFEVIGTVPAAFRHPVKGYVGLHVMYRHL